MVFSEIDFAEWCLTNEKYSFDAKQKFWYDSKTLVRISWKEIYKEYKKLSFEKIYKKYSVSK